ncbi:MAG: M23 family metallopeptidase [Spirochaetaceae bacterium]|nr:M23 family metallopeptidase [Spirochaetaceae bacterium]
MKISVIRFVMIAAFFSLAVFAFGEQKTHTVQKGETLYSISRQYGLTVNELRQLNGLSDTSVLKVGQVLKVSAPETTTASSAATSASASGASSSAGNTSSSSTATTYEKYTVKAGDTFYSIARASGITVAELKKINNFGDDAVLKYGTVIKVPAKTTAETSTATASASAATTPATATAPTSGEVLLSVTDDPRKYDSNKKGNINLEWPVKAKEVTYVSGKISGVTITATKNEAVVAIKEGNVTFSGFYRGFGNVVFIKSSAGYIYVYSGLGSVSVTLGTAVKHGDKIGTVGTDSLSGKTQINLMVYKNGMVIDPAVAPRG